MEGVVLTKTTSNIAVQYDGISKQCNEELASSGTKNINISFIVGFIDAEGSFLIYMRKSSRYSQGWQVKPVFSIGLHTKDLLLLENICAFLDVGRIYKKPGSVHLQVENLEGINRLIKILGNNPFISQKRADFELFKKAVELINQGEHLTKEGLEKIVAIRASMNLGLSEGILKAFPDINSYERPSIQTPSVIDSNWLAGFAEGESNFAIRVSSSVSHILGKSVSLRFTITQHKRDISLLNSIEKSLGCGQVKERSAHPCADYIVTNFREINEVIIPFFEKFPLTGNKKLDYLDFCKAAELIKNKVHLTKEGLDEIIRIKDGMNKGRNPPGIS